MAELVGDMQIAWQTLTTGFLLPALVWPTVSYWGICRVKQLMKDIIVSFLSKIGNKYTLKKISPCQKNRGYVF